MHPVLSRNIILSNYVHTEWRFITMSGCRIGKGILSTKHVANLLNEAKHFGLKMAFFICKDTK